MFRRTKVGVLMYLVAYDAMYEGYVADSEIICLLSGSFE
jgi:hypothetical protein